MLQRISKRTKAVRSLIQEVVGLSPYEKRLLDMLKTGGASAEKRMYKLSKRRVSFCLIICSLLILGSDGNVCFVVDVNSLVPTPELRRSVTRSRTFTARSEPRPP